MARNVASSRIRNYSLKTRYIAAVAKYHRILRHLRYATGIYTRAERDLLGDFLAVAKREYGRFRGRFVVQRWPNDWDSGPIGVESTKPDRPAGRDLRAKAVEVLLVDDNFDDICLVCQALAEEPVPINVRVAVDGEQAIQMLAIRKPDLVILDLTLPRLSGLSLLERWHIDAPVVIFTRSSDIDDLFRSLELGAKEFVRKPTDLRDFAEAVSQIVRNWGSQDAAVPDR
jgi:two-component system, chemotaxis family, response regulator Rcp1